MADTEKDNNGEERERSILPDENLETVEPSKTIFSQEEINSMVEGFVLAWLRGAVKIKFPTGESIMAGRERKGNPIDSQKAHALAAQSKATFITLIQICGGIQASSQEELQQATNRLFSIVLKAKAGNRIEGTFLEFDIERKLADFETKLEATNRVVEQLIKWLTEEASADDKMP